MLTESFPHNPWGIQSQLCWPVGTGTSWIRCATVVLTHELQAALFTK
uniref:Uncharacterized protein n=1 Tax=Anguilla anguilla TaxID=7936 RepID=A0A0E9U9P6_ANGAN